MVARPAYTLDGMPRKPSPYITDAMWWFWVLLNRYDPLLELGGIFANKPGFHNTGLNNLRNWPLNYSIRDLVNRSGPWWQDFAAAIDVTFPEAQRGDYSRISLYSNRIRNSAKDPNDPRLDDNMYQFFGQTDNDSEVEGWNEYKEESSSSDPSHLWHIHDETQRNKCGDFDCMWAKLTVWMGWTVEQWRRGNDMSTEDTAMITASTYRDLAILTNMPVVYWNNGDEPKKYHNPEDGLMYSRMEVNGLREHLVRIEESVKTLSAPEIDYDKLAAAMLKAGAATDASVRATVRTGLTGGADALKEEE